MKSSIRVVLSCLAALALAACASTERRANDAHQEFKREVKPAADWVDEKTNKAVDEGKKAVDKTAKAITGDDDEPQSRPSAGSKADPANGESGPEQPAASPARE